MLEYEGRLAHEDHAGEQRGAGGDVDGAERVAEQQGGEEDGDRGAGEDDAQGVGDRHQGHAGQGRHEAYTAQQAWYQYSTILYISIHYIGLHALEHDEQFLAAAPRQQRLSSVERVERAGEDL